MKAADKLLIANSISLNACKVTAARGHANKTGGIVWSGLLWIKDTPVAEFRNGGEGGCVDWKIRDQQLFEQFEELAKAIRPWLKFEQADNVVGELWDAAYTKRSA